MWEREGERESEKEDIYWINQREREDKVLLGLLLLGLFIGFRVEKKNRQHKGNGEKVKKSYTSQKEYEIYCGKRIFLFKKTTTNK